jgi:hypothetical protein
MGLGEIVSTRSQNITVTCTGAANSVRGGHAAEPMPEVMMAS